MLGTFGVICSHRVCVLAIQLNASRPSPAVPFAPRTYTRTPTNGVMLARHVARSRDGPPSLEAPAVADGQSQLVPRAWVRQKLSITARPGMVHYFASAHRIQGRDGLGWWPARARHKKS